MRAATISFAELQVRLLFEGGYYSGCGFYSNKYGTQEFLLFILYLQDTGQMRLTEETIDQISIQGFSMSSVY